MNQRVSNRSIGARHRCDELLRGQVNERCEQLPSPASYSGRDYGGYPAAKLRMSAGDG
jgi:hypothetical protein